MLHSAGDVSTDEFNFAGVEVSFLISMIVSSAQRHQDSMFQGMFHAITSSAPCSRESVLALSASPALLAYICTPELHCSQAWPSPHWRVCSHVARGHYTSHDKYLSVISCFCCLFLPRLHCTCAWCHTYYPQSKKPRSATAYVCKLIKRRPTQGYVLCTHPPKKSALQRQRTRPTFGTWSSGGRKTPRIIESRRSLNLLPILNVHNW